MDIGVIKSHNAKLDIVHPGTEKKTGLTVYLRPDDEPNLRRVLKEGETEGYKFAQRGKVPNSNERDEHAIKVITAAIAEWEWKEDDDGTPATFNGEVPELTSVNVRALIRAFPNFQTQIEEAYTDKRRFFRE